MIKAIVTDIEGTTSSLAFVKDILFPYARAALPDYVRVHQTDPAVSDILDEVAQLTACPRDDLESLTQTLVQWIDEDRKITPLKLLQGLIWEEGYQKGEYQGHLYPDAIECLQRWHQQGYQLYVYSSGSVQAQQLLFAHTNAGDLRPLFSGYFDTRTGAKQDVNAYRSIIQTIGLPADEIVFLSDIVAELDAAAAAGMQTRWLVRPPAQPDISISHVHTSDFYQIHL
ncbi:MAG: hypothetical protein RIQ52_1338 [Pseudomonadota bacterium]